MSSYDYDSPCPKCGGVMNCSGDTRPYQSAAGQCLNCGFEYWTQEGQMSLEDVNEIRTQSYELPPLTELTKQTT